MMTPDLLRLSREGGGPFQLRLIGAPVLNCAEIVRRIADRRLVCRGTWNDQPVYAKIFIGEHAVRYAERDARGAKALAQHDIATPVLLHVGDSAKAAAKILIYAAIADSRDAELAWQSASPAQRSQLAAELVSTVARHHVAGLVQTDLYLRNFLCADRLYTLDGDGIRISSGPIPWSRAMPNLALLLSKFDVEDDTRIPDFLSIYTAQRGWQASSGMLSGLKKQVGITRLSIARQYAQKKVLRDCTDVRVLQDFGRFMAVSRAQQHDSLANILATPDAWLDSPDCHRMKNGNTCTVGLVTAGNKKIVIKRYNIKNLRHGMGRLWRPTRAGVSWSNAHLLRMLGIATAQPLALIESRWGPLRREGYFLAEYVDGPDIAEVFADTCLDAQYKQEVATKVARLLHRLYLLGLEHGDFKATNLKIVDGEPLLIDLDAMRLHRKTAWFEKRHARDLRRFMKNWQHDPATLELMKNAIEAAYQSAPILKIAGID